jgi:hypothetical protein
VKALFDAMPSPKRSAKMSHFCVSANDDTEARYITASNGSDATAYVWGGASGAEYGQILEIWCAEFDMRIAANEETPPASWIVSYTIPSLYAGSTFVGVKPGTQRRETANSVFFALDTPSEAKKRCDRYANEAVSAGACPSFLRSEVWRALLTGTKKHEGCTDFMYNDLSTPKQLVTVGVGKMLVDLRAALNIKEYFINSDGNVSGEAEIKADFERVQKLKRTGGKQQSNLYEFAAITAQRMPIAKIHELLSSFMAEKVRPVPDMFPGFGEFPASAQIACCSIAYGGWGHSCFDLLKAAIRSRDWSRAADVYRDPGWAPNKGEWHRRLFRDAAQGR